MFSLQRVCFILARCQWLDIERLRHEMSCPCLGVFDPELEWRACSSLLDRHVKLFTDGAIFSELMQMQGPGFIDGHHGEWMTAPEQFGAAERAYWNAGYRNHVHCTGDLGLELVVLDRLQFERTRFDHRFTIEHLGASNEEQVRRIKALGALVSAKVYHLREPGEAYWYNSIGHERASQMARLGSLEGEGVPFALHSVFTMAPPARPPQTRPVYWWLKPAVLPKLTAWS